MEGRKVRNEFGLDEKNPFYVQKERAKNWMLWIGGVIAFAVAACFMMFVLPRMF